MCVLGPMQISFNLDLNTFHLFLVLPELEKGRKQVEPKLQLIYIGAKSSHSLIRAKRAD